MKELTPQEVSQVSGAGIIQDTLENLGSVIGDGLYGVVSNISVELPIVGEVSLSSVWPDLGENVGSLLGSSVGGAIENVISSIPLVGGLLNSLLGN